MAALTRTAANVKPSSRAKYLPQYLTGAAIEAGQPVYLDANFLWQLSDANAASPANRVDGIAPVNAAAGQPLSPVYEDPDFTHGLATVAAGDVVIPGDTAGALHPVGDAASGWYVTVVMIAISATKAVLKIVAAGVAK